MSDEQKYIIEGLDEYIREGEPWDIRDRRVSFPPVDYVLELIPLSSLTNQSALNP